MVSWVRVGWKKFKKVTSVLRLKSLSPRLRGELHKSSVKSDEGYDTENGQ